MKDAISMHVIDRFDELVHVILDSAFWQVVTSTLDSVIHVHVHQLEYECESARWLVIEDLE